MYSHEEMLDFIQSVMQSNSYVVVVVVVVVVIIFNNPTAMILTTTITITTTTTTTITITITGITTTTTYYCSDCLIDFGLLITAFCIAATTINIMNIYCQGKP
jgi:archaellum biogenesis protein FlaJ (TadC family)